MSSNVNNDKPIQNNYSTPHSSPEGKGALAFAWEKIKELGEALLICLGCLSIVGIPFVYNAYKPEFKPSVRSIENKPATRELLEEQERVRQIEEQQKKEIRRRDQAIAAKMRKLERENAAPEEMGNLKEDLLCLMEVYIARARQYIQKHKSPIPPHEREKINQILFQNASVLIHSYGLDIHPQRVILEIAEDALMTDLQAAKEDDTWRETLFAYGYDEEDFSEVISKYNFLTNQAFL